jgi:hypothetical protein
LYTIYNILHSTFYFQPKLRGFFICQTTREVVSTLCAYCLHAEQGPLDGRPEKCEHHPLRYLYLFLPLSLVLLMPNQFDPAGDRSIIGSSVVRARYLPS